MGGGFKNEKFRISALFFADDGLLLSEDVDSATRTIDNLKRISNGYGLEITDQPNKIESLNVQCSRKTRESSKSGGSE